MGVRPAGWKWLQTTILYFCTTILLCCATTLLQCFPDGEASCLEMAPNLCEGVAPRRACRRRAPLRSPERLVPCQVGRLAKPHETPPQPALDTRTSHSPITGEEVPLGVLPNTARLTGAPATYGLRLLAVSSLDLPGAPPAARLPRDGRYRCASRVLLQ